MKLRDFSHILSLLALFSFVSPVAHALDLNANQQSDVWEMIHNATGMAATNDADADGFNNRAESIAGTDPLNSNSYPAVDGVAASETRFTNRVASVNGKTYAIQTSLDMENWSTVTNVSGSGGDLQPGINSAGITQQYVRVLVGDKDTDGDGVSDYEELALNFNAENAHTERYEQLDSNRVTATFNLMSTVTVAVLDGQISERWPDAGVFAIRRSGGIKPITVNFTLSGSATRGIDYTTAPGNTISIPAGIREVWIECMPVADTNDAEATETIVLTVSNGTGYVLGSTVTGTVSLANETDASLPSAKAAARFLVQAAFGPDQDSTNDVDQIPENVEEVMAMGFEAWIDDQFTRPVGLLQPFAEYSYTNLFQFYNDPKQAAWWNRAMGVPSLRPDWPPQLPDPLRQRLAFALSQILVVSDRPETLAVEPISMANYYDMLVTNAFRTYRDLLFNVTTHPVMGFYLSHLKNRKPDYANNIFPDENYAREVMQLFSIGLWELNQDGTRRLDTNGLPIPTYDNNDITEFARVFTGMSYGPTNTIAFLNAPQNFLVPMKRWDSYHDCNPKTLLNGQVLPARVESNPDIGTATLLDVDAAMDNLFWHTNVAPFIGKQLIQRFVTSNPSTGYVARVAAAFNDNGLGVRGDMKAVLKAILLDDEARNPANMLNPQFGKQREPFLRVVNLARAFNAYADAGYYALDQFYLDHYEQPMNSPSVFNFYLPGYLPPGHLANAGLLGPEFQILNAGSAISAPNYYFHAVSGGLHRWGNGDPTRVVKLNYVPEMTMITNNIDGLIRRLDLSLMYGTLSPREFQIIRESVERIAPYIWEWDKERMNLTVYLMVTSPEYCVMR